VRITLYGMVHSHPVLAVRMMLDAKGLPHTRRDVLPGLHPLVVRAAGFPGRTVPALRLGDRLVQGTLQISRALDELVPDPPLHPGDARVDEAERWAHDELQPVAARLFRLLGRDHAAVRTWMLDEVVRWPALPPLVAAMQPVMAYYAKVVGATPERVRQDLRELPAKLDHLDGLVAEGVLGGPVPNAADCQALASLRLLAAHEDLHDLVTGHACGRLAMQRLPAFPGLGVAALAPVPAVLPAGWLAAG
jgi:glutathione S-transferase